MLSVSAALAQVLQHTAPLRATNMRALDSVGCTLAEAVSSDVDSPPYDKAMVDGYAVLLADFAVGAVEVKLTMLEEITAGALPKLPLAAGSTSRIMTGAPLPANAEAVVMIEQTEAQTAATGEVSVTFREVKIRPELNIMRRAASLAIGQTVMEKGQTLRALDVGVLAEVGRTEVQVVRPPRVAVLTTGNELVTADKMPAAGQIRNSNSPMLVAMCASAGAEAVDLGIGRDEESAIAALVREGLTRDVLILSGGVSAGVLDLVPKVLQAEGVQKVFHKVELKPGKPIWFGVAEKEGHKTLVFGLPGNPVGALVCFELFVRPALLKLAGRKPDRAPLFARLEKEYAHRGDRPTYFPAKLHAATKDEFIPQVEPLPWLGSADLATLAKANCLAYFPPGERKYAAGEVLEILMLE